MTPEQLDDIEARADAASTWPWEWAGRDLESAEGAVIATSVDCMPYCYGGTARMEMSHEDNEFLLHARADIPALVAEVRRLRSTVEQIRELVLPSADQAEDENLYGLVVDIRRLVYEPDPAISEDKEKA